MRQEAVALTDPATLWPDGIASELAKLADADFAFVSAADSIANAKSIADADSVSFSDNGSGTVAQKVRAQLGLPASTNCG